MVPALQESNYSPRVETSEYTVNPDQMGVTRFSETQPAPFPLILELVDRIGDYSAETPVTTFSKFGTAILK